MRKSAFNAIISPRSDSNKHSILCASKFQASISCVLYKQINIPYRKDANFSMPSMISKRDGRTVPFDDIKIQQALEKALIATGNVNAEKTALKLTQQVVGRVEEELGSEASVEGVQDIVERVLIDCAPRIVSLRCHPGRA